MRWSLAALPAPRRLTAGATWSVAAAFARPPDSRLPPLFSPLARQIEGVLPDVDFKRTKVTRAELEEMCADLFDRATLPMEDALKAAGMTIVCTPLPASVPDGFCATRRRALVTLVLLRQSCFPESLVRSTHAIEF